ncbi:hypothetical protein E2C01_048408 [Portunus trituberculatus]|uniref:Uncharacterized protein n=1 Tax=Portunus trituberculatus TaxID=210409 RepID=A0A5B7G329_PORTR|nr:hypothetical protein [Portunus trituberculatus]
MRNVHSTIVHPTYLWRQNNSSRGLLLLLLHSDALGRSCCAQHNTSGGPAHTASIVYLGTAAVRLTHSTAAEERGFSRLVSFKATTRRARHPSRVPEAAAARPRVRGLPVVCTH